MQLMKTSFQNAMHYSAMQSDRILQTNALEQLKGLFIASVTDVLPPSPLSLTLVSKLVTKSPHRSNCSTISTLFSCNLGLFLFSSQ